MKKSLLSLVCLFSIMFLGAQTFVSTTPSKKNVVLEDFTGINCPQCPDGHKRANDIAKAHPGRVVLINVHAGSFAPDIPNYKTPYGEAILSQAGVGGYPNATINRHLFSGKTNTAMGRGEWATYSGQILAQDSYVNVAAKSTINKATRELTVEVEVYYTGNSPVATNRLNVALLQGNIVGPQSGMTSNPDYVIGDQYKHMHILRRYLTGQWGDVIDNTAQGAFHSFTYKYTIPEKSFNVAYKLEDIEIAVFLAESSQEIITGVLSEPGVK